MSIFTKSMEMNNQPNRNTFDLSFANNFTTKFGQLTPVFCKEVIPGDSFRIEPTFGLKFMPLYFPIQTRVKTYLHFFYVRNRNLWKNWQEFITRQDSTLVSPYIEGNEGQISEMFGTSKSADYLGCPTTSFGDYGNDVEFTTVDVISNPLGIKGPRVSEAITRYYDVLKQNGGYSFQPFNISGSVSTISGLYAIVPYNDHIEGPMSIRDFPSMHLNNGETYNIPFLMPAGVPDAASSNPEYIVMCIAYFDSDGNYLFSDVGEKIDYLAQEPVTVKCTHDPSEYYTFCFYYCNVAVDERGAFKLQSNPHFQERFSITLSKNGHDYSSLVPHYSNIYNSATSPIRISALPFRAYESVYNAFYRDPVLDPFTIDGKEQPNKFIPNDEGGADSIVYPLYFRRYESDFLTSAVTSPQQGVAPLVGLSNVTSDNVTMRFQNQETNEVYEAIAKIGEDGETIQGIQVKSPDMPAGTLRQLVDQVSTGISINDFRNVNALQRWLETNLRKRRYRDIIDAHYGVNIKYDTVDMPEFIGGAVQDFNINQISATTSGQDGQQLGDFAGQGYCVGNGKSTSCYCDEHGFIIGIMSIVPTPMYSQLLPKHYLKRDALDYFYPEFGHIGLQPICYDEVCPLQSSLAGDNVNDVFGYQRAWYDYLASTDEVHGDFRDTLRDFLINRQFGSRPELGHDFITINPDDLNNVFNYTADTDKIMGQIYFDVKAKRPIPMFGRPRLE